MWRFHKMNYRIFLLLAFLSSCSPQDFAGSTDFISTSSGTTDLYSAPSSTSSTTITSDSENNNFGVTESYSICKNGIIENNEKCDDGNLIDNDKCNNDCKKNYLVFVTEMEFSPDLIGGLKGADSLCKQLAHKADLDRWETFTAWLSDSKENAYDRIHKTDGYYIRVDGEIIAIGIYDLIDNSLINSISISEKGNFVSNGVWTGTLPNGTTAPNSSHCNDWFSDSLLENGYWGFSAHIDPTWTFYNEGPVICAAQARLYCFEGE